LRDPKVIEHLNSESVRNFVSSDLLLEILESERSGRRRNLSIMVSSSTSTR
jgi:hypothetical protein